MIESSFNGRRIVLFSGGEPKTNDDLLKEVRELALGGSFGSIMGRNVFQRPNKEAQSLLKTVMSIYTGNM